MQNQNLDSSKLSSRWAQFPMGPKLRKFLGIEEASYRSAALKPHSHEDLDKFQADLAEFIALNPVDNEGRLTDLVEELVAMKLPEAAIALAERNPGHWNESDFRSLLSLGTASMISGRLEDAIRIFNQAKVVAPKEPSSYTNLVQIYLHLQDDESAMRECRLGLMVEPNNQRLWEQLGFLYQQQSGEQAPQKILELAYEMNSWRGISFGEEWSHPDNPEFKAAALEKLYDSGEHHPEFLIELTGALGFASQFARIPAILWQAETFGADIHWQLLMHVAQAYFGMEQKDQAQKILERLKSRPDIPDNVRPYIDELMKEATSTTLH